MSDAARRQRDLPALFALEATGPRRWCGASDLIDLPQPFGGQLVGQSVVAADRAGGTDRRVHSVHTTFVGAGEVGRPVAYAVEALAEGRSRSTWQVDARQGDRLLCRSTVSSTTASEGIDHAPPMPAVHLPEHSPSLADLAQGDGGLGGFWDGFEAIEVRVSPPLPTPAGGTGLEPGRRRPAPAAALVWMRPAAVLPDDPVLHQAALAYASDLMLLGAAVTAHGVPLGHERTLAANWWGISLDHTVWFAPDVRFDDWLLFEHSSPVAWSSRAVVEARVFDRRGGLVARVAQEALVRRAR